MKSKRKSRKNVIVRKNRNAKIITKIKYFVFIVFPVIILVVGSYFVFITIKSTFQIKNIVFTDNEHLTDEELKKLAGIKGRENLIMVSGSKIFSKMVKSQWLRSVSIRKEFPDTLHIRIKEAEPFALLDIKGRLFIVDERGKMLQELKESPIPFLPVISGTPFRNKDVFSEALNFVRVIREKGLLFEKDHIEIIAHEPQEMSVNLDGVFVKVGVGDYEDKLLRLMEMEEEIKRRKIHVDYIDLRFENRVVVKPVKEVIH
jgi:cell division protein FtsQ